ncbi:hypothetical protein GCM10011409_01940 [Lentibacillus populi]|uniref:Uncharacterized protein n=1 Tax=Lentibacillus populi TaxID=1827502 RepID=A0A9W5X3R9_9BACI|nr:hypothetical protein GCM10011409_01940 [Lentibacillus populi]
MKNYVERFFYKSDKTRLTLQFSCARVKKRSSKVRGEREQKETNSHMDERKKNKDWTRYDQ